MNQGTKLEQKPVLSIIIINWNTRWFLQQNLQSIYNTVANLDIEILVVDNASSDTSVEMIRSQFSQVKLILTSENLGFSRAANRALSEGRGDYFLLAHADLKFLPGAIEEMLSFLLTHPQVGIVGGNLMYPDGSYNTCSIKRLSIRQTLVEFVYAFRGIIKKFPWLYEQFMQEHDSFYWDHQTTLESKKIWNACMMFRKEVIETIGNFCEEFFIWFADTDWCHRATDAGWKAYYLTSAKVVHYEKQSSDYLDNEQVNYKIDGFLIRSQMNADRYTLLKRHHSLFFLGFRKCIDALTIWRIFLKRAVLWVLRHFKSEDIKDNTQSL